MKLQEMTVMTKENKNDKRFYLRAESVEYTTIFPIAQCFCNCSLEINGPHRENCPNFGETQEDLDGEHKIVVIFVGENNKKYKLTSKIIDRKWEEIT